MLNKEVARRYNIEPGKVYEASFRYGNKVSGTGALLSSESAAKLAEHWDKGDTSGELVFVAAQAKH